MAHGLVEATGYSHFPLITQDGRRELFHAGYNRVYDSLEPENQPRPWEEVMDHILNGMGRGDMRALEIHRRIGEFLHRRCRGGEF